MSANTLSDAAQSGAAQSGAVLRPGIDVRLKQRAVRRFDLSPLLQSEQAIDEKATALGWGAGSALTGTADGLGYLKTYAGGAVLVWRADRGALAVYGAIGARWAEIGGVASSFGWPQNDETGTPNPPGRYNHFDGGSIYWSPATGAHLIYGAIRDLWASLGWENSALGFPTTDEQDVPGVPGARRNAFEGGEITWTPATGARVTRLNVAGDTQGGSVHITTVGGGGAQPGPQVSRHVIVQAAMDITDDETFGSDEHRHVEGRDERWIDSWDPQGVLQLIGKCGGEVRVELNGTAAVRPDGSVRLGLDVKLYEGTSEETNDLDGTRTIDQVIPVDGVVQIPVRINNDDEGGDFADISLTVSNSAT